MTAIAFIARYPRLVLASVAALLIALAVWQYHRMGAALEAQERAAAAAVATAKQATKAAAATDSVLVERDATKAAIQRDREAAHNLTKEPETYDSIPLSRPDRLALCRAAGLQVCPSADHP